MNRGKPADRARAGPSLWREPLVQFLLVGLIIAGLYYLVQRHRSIYRIEIGPERVAQLVESYRKQYGTTPGPEAREALVEADIADEMLFREARALGLERGDEVIRRRVIQKMRFLSEDLDPPAEPTAQEIAAYYARHAGRYAVPAGTSFTHIYFADGRGDGRVRAERALVQLRSSDPGRAVEGGDPFPDLYDFSGYTPDQTVRLFGRSPFSRAVGQAPVGRWTGPFRSGYGWHLLKVTMRIPATPLLLDRVRDRVRADLLADGQRARNRRQMDELRRRFTMMMMR